MKVEILRLMKKPFPIAMALGTAAQIALAFVMIRFAQGAWNPPRMSEADAEAYFLELIEGSMTAGDRGGGTGGVMQTKKKKRSESEVSLLKGDGESEGSGAQAKAKQVHVSVREEEWEMDDLALR